MERSACGRKIGCCRGSGYVGAATHVERETSSIVAPIGTRNICGIDQVRPGRIQLADERVSAGAKWGWLKSCVSPIGRKIRGIGCSSHDYVKTGIRRDSSADVGPSAT